MSGRGHVGVARLGFAIVAMGFLCQALVEIGIAWQKHQRHAGRVEVRTFAAGGPCR
jgi:hypothetical protein